MKKILAAAWPALLIASLILLPWLNKAHTTDDTTFLLMADHVLTDPLHPAAFEMMADGNRIRLSSQLVSGPVMAYLLVPSVLLGGAEWAAHLVQYFLILAAICATVSLALRLGLDDRGARVAGILLASTPAVMAMATTSMADVPAMSFAILGMERFVAWRQQGRWHQGLAASLLLAFAALTRPHLILILAVACFLEFLLGASPSRFMLHPDCRGQSPSECGGLPPPSAFMVFKGGSKLPHSAVPMRWILLHLVPIIAAAAIILLITFLTADPLRSGSHFMTASISRFHPVNAASNTAAFFAHWLLVFPLGLLWFCLGIRWKRLWCNPSPWIAAIITLSICLLDRNEHKVPVYALALAFAGAFIIIDLAMDACRRRDFIQILLWLWLLLALPAIAYVQLPCRYLLGAAPAAAILLAFLIRRKDSFKFIKWVAVSAGVALSLLIIAADAEFGNFGRRIAAEQIAPMVSRGHRVWVNGEWGFEWYALKAGAFPVAKQPPYPSAGDILFSSTAAPHLPLEMFPNRQLISSFAANSHFGRVMSRPAGFYSNGYGYLPWIFGSNEIENIGVWLTNPFEE